MSTQRFILLPTGGMRASPASTSPTFDFLVSASRGVPIPASASATYGGVHVIDSMHENGAKLVECTLERMNALRAAEPGLRVVPEVFYAKALAPRPAVASGVKAASGPNVKIRLTVVASGGGQPVAGAQVVAFTDFANRFGASGTTNAAGKVSLALGGSAVKVQRLYVYPPLGLWSRFRKNVTLSNATRVTLKRLVPTYADCIRDLYGTPPSTAGSGVTVGVIDTGVGPHPDLVVAGGANTVIGELVGDFTDGDEHGTHVAGIIAAHGLAPTGRSGLAPAASLRAYRVFGAGASGASNYSIAKALDLAVADGCDLVNISISGGSQDAAISGAIADARAAGTLVIVAAGNDDRSPVGFPANDPRALAVSAMGRKKTFPSGTTESADVAAPFGVPDARDFMAAFSNIGSAIDVVGAGVGVVSTVPGGYSPMSGTSMASPAVTGFAAQLLAGAPHILQATRDQARSDAIAKLLLSHARLRGFGATFEGLGLPL